MPSESGTHISVWLGIYCRDAAQDIALVVSWRLILVVAAIAHTKGVANLGKTCCQSNMVVSEMAGDGSEGGDAVRQVSAEAYPSYLENCSAPVRVIAS